MDSEQKMTEDTQEPSASLSKIAIPVAEGKLSAHFGHCNVFAFFDVKDNTVVRKELVPAPLHQPGLLPAWLYEQQATVVIVGGIGTRAKDLLVRHGIRVMDGVSPDEPDAVVAAYLAGTLTTGDSFCDH